MGDTKKYHKVSLDLLFVDVGISIVVIIYISENS